MYTMLPEIFFIYQNICQFFLNIKILLQYFKYQNTILLLEIPKYYLCIYN